jgi:hypothetical protein
MTWPTRRAAICDMPRTPHDGPNPRRLQLSASSLSYPHSLQESVGQDAALAEGIDSSLMNRGRSALVLTSVWAMKLAVCCCTKLYRVVYSGL